MLNVRREFRYGSPDTSMQPHANLRDEQNWERVFHLRN